MKPLIALLAAALGVAAVALVADSPALVIVAVLMIVGVTVGAFALGVNVARQGDFVLPYLAAVVVGLVLAAIGVTAIIVGDRADAPGLVLLGTVLIVSVIVGALAYGVRTARR